ncbi:hypothetical protein B0H14DRAFT_2611277 [Mycena olivaceomarginata]|nr:hypothetical protein B0H14DRAFT_2611277 [Mycena olivaceomarginata]
MDTDNTFKKSDWIDKGKKWADTPPALKKIAAQWFLIPQELEHDILPSPFLLITKLLESLSLLRARLSPPSLLSISKTVNKLLANSRQCWLDGVQSVVYSHLGAAVTHFLLWVLTYWSAVHNIKHDAWVPWRNCQAWVNHQKKVGGGNKHDAGDGSLGALQLSFRKFSRHIEQQMLVPIGLLPSRTALITSGHLGPITDEPHWVAVIFDMTQPEGVVRYGDSFGNKIPEELAAACRWWLNQHTSEDLELTDLPIAH